MSPSYVVDAGHGRSGRAVPLDHDEQPDAPWNLDDDRRFIRALRRFQAADRALASDLPLEQQHAAIDEYLEARRAFQKAIERRDKWIPRPA